jgi:hypothetical protein
MRLFALSAVLLVGAAPAAVAGTLIVSDCGDTTPGGGGPGQLRRLINDANPGDLILVPACTIALTGSSGDDANDTGDLDITKNLTIQGTGATTVITRDPGLADRLVHVQAGVIVTLSDLTINGGGGAPVNGAGILNQGELHLAGVTVSAGTGQDGGGLYNDPGATLVLTDSTVQGNHASGGNGGGIYNKGTVSLTRTGVVQNDSTFAGAGISNWGGTLTLTDSTVSGNQTSGQTTGGGIASYTGGSVTITGSTVSGNTTWMAGGGIYTESATTIENSTISGNHLSHLTGADASGGGGLYVQLPGTASLIRVTVASNTIDSGSGSGLFNNGGFTGLTLKATLVAGNDCAGGAPPVSHNRNLDEGNTCGFAGTGDLTNVGDARLGALLNNGGPTLTHMPRTDSAAVDAGGATCAGAPTDQRGVSRPQGTACDIGAVEVTDLIFQDGFESGSTAAWSLTVDDGGDLSVTPAAALAGSLQGLQAVVNDTAGMYVEDLSPTNETRYRARFYFDTNSYDPGESLSHFRTRLFVMFDDAGTRRLSAIVLKRQGGSYSVLQRCRLDDNSQAQANNGNNGFIPISSGLHEIAVEWRRATGPASNDGFCQLTIDDGAATATLPAIQNNVSLLGIVRLGTQNVKAGASGTPYFDEFVSKRIGAIPPIN